MVQIAFFQLSITFELLNQIKQNSFLESSHIMPAVMILNDLFQGLKLNLETRGFQFQRSVTN